MHGQITYSIHKTLQGSRRILPRPNDIAPRIDRFLELARVVDDKSGRFAQLPYSEAGQQYAADDHKPLRAIRGIWRFHQFWYRRLRYITQIFTDALLQSRYWYVLRRGARVD